MATQQQIDALTSGAAGLGAPSGYALYDPDVFPGATPEQQKYGGASVIKLSTYQAPSAQVSQPVIQTTTTSNGGGQLSSLRSQEQTLISSLSSGGLSPNQWTATRNQLDSVQDQISNVEFLQSGGDPRTLRTGGGGGYGLSDTASEMARAASAFGTPTTTLANLPVVVATPEHGGGTIFTTSYLPGAQAYAETAFASGAQGYIAPLTSETAPIAFGATNYSPTPTLTSPVLTNVLGTFAPTTTQQAAIVLGEQRTAVQQAQLQLIGIQQIGSQLGQSLVEQGILSGLTPSSVISQPIISTPTSILITPTQQQSQLTTSQQLLAGIMGTTTQIKQTITPAISAIKTSEAYKYGFEQPSKDFMAGFDQLNKLTGKYVTSKLVPSEKTFENIYGELASTREAYYKEARGTTGIKSFALSTVGGFKEIGLFSAQALGQISKNVREKPLSLAAMYAVSVPIGGAVRGYQLAKPAIASFLSKASAGRLGMGALNVVGTTAIVGLVGGSTAYAGYQLGTAGSGAEAGRRFGDIFTGLALTGAGFATGSKLVSSFAERKAVAGATLSESQLRKIEPTITREQFTTSRLIRQEPPIIVEQKLSLPKIMGGESKLIVDISATGKITTNLKPLSANIKPRVSTAQSITDVGEYTAGISTGTKNQYFIQAGINARTLAQELTGMSQTRGEGIFTIIPLAKGAKPIKGTVGFQQLGKSTEEGFIGLATSYSKVPKQEPVFSVLGVKGTKFAEVQGFPRYKTQSFVSTTTGRVKELGGGILVQKPFEISFKPGETFQFFESRGASANILRAKNVQLQNPVLPKIEGEIIVKRKSTRPFDFSIFKPKEVKIKPFEELPVSESGLVQLKTKPKLEKEVKRTSAPPLSEAQFRELIKPRIIEYESAQIRGRLSEELSFIKSTGKSRAFPGLVSEPGKKFVSEAQKFIREPEISAYQISIPKTNIFSIPKTSVGRVSGSAQDFFKKLGQGSLPKLSSVTGVESKQGVKQEQQPFFKIDQAIGLVSKQKQQPLFKIDQALPPITSTLFVPPPPVITIPKIPPPTKPPKIPFFGGGGGGGFGGKRGGFISPRRLQYQQSVYAAVKGVRLKKGRVPSFLTGVEVRGVR